MLWPNHIRPRVLRPASLNAGARLVAGECPERQRGRTVNPLAYAFVGSSPTSPTTLNFQGNSQIAFAGANGRKTGVCYRYATCSSDSAEHQLHRLLDFAAVDVLEQMAVDVERHGDG